VIATGLEQEEPIRDNVIRPHFGNRSAAPPQTRTVHPTQNGVPAKKAVAAQALAAVGAESGYGRQAGPAPRANDYTEALPFARDPQRPISGQQVMDLDIPTFIRRQMD
jgi:hypothetical protein